MMEQMELDMRTDAEAAAVETAAALPAIGRFVEEMAQEAIMMAAKARVCIDYLTNQERVRDVDPETGEILEEENDN